jgi:hypothetical protein
LSEDFFNGSNGKAPVDIHAIMDSDLPGLIANIVSLGVLVSIGTTRDRGAFTITITSDGKYRREYFQDSTDAADFVRGARAALGGELTGAPATDGPTVRRPLRARQKVRRDPI